MNTLMKKLFTFALVASVMPAQADYTSWFGERMESNDGPLYPTL